MNESCERINESKMRMSEEGKREGGRAMRGSHMQPV